MTDSANPQDSEVRATDPSAPTLLDIAIPIAEAWRLLLLSTLAAAVLAFGITFLVKPTFTARTSFLPPQQQNGVAASALASLGALSTLIGTGSSTRTPADQYVTLLQSTVIADRLVDEFKLLDVYETKYRVKARQTLGENVRIAAGKKDGLISIEVDDSDPGRAAGIANRYVEELRSLTSRLALTEAQERRAFFEQELKRTRDRLAAAQAALQASGFTEGTLRAEPKAAAEGYARLRAEFTAAEVRLQTLRRNFLDSTPEVQQQRAAIAALRSELAKVEESAPPSNGADYIGKYREFKYQETLFELFARQYESARLDESREGGLIQVVDVAVPPELKSRPKRALVTAVAALAGLALAAIYIVARHFWRESQADEVQRAKAMRLAAAFRRR